MAQDQRERTASSTGVSSRPLARREDLRDPYGDPFRAMRRMFDQFNRWPFESFGLPIGLSSARSGLTSGWMPQIDTFQRGDQFVVRADLPGLEKKDVNVEIQDGALVIEGERTTEQEQQEESYFTSERTYGQFCRVVPLPEGAMADSVKASFRNGVLEVTMKAPSRLESRGRKIEVTG